ncbi:ion transporter [Rhodobacteraceae bacterium WD3A24]|nr:ion transporter [Rhodobacteraceae bacterium WD3A24]
MAFDIATIVFFIATTPIIRQPWVIAADLVIAMIIAADFAARLWIAENRAKFLRRIYNLADIVVVVSLLTIPFAGTNLALLRVLRALRLIHSYHVLRDLRRDTAFFRRHEDTVLAAVNLFVFVFLMSSVVFVLRGGQEAGLTSYVDAIYFTVTTLTTTGYGDIAMSTPMGRLLSVAIMIIGVALFFRLAQAIVAPPKVRYTCPECGLSRHDRDAVHCKHCGHELKIETEGAT